MDGADVELGTEREGVGAAVEDRAGDDSTGGRRLDGVGQQLGRCPVRGSGVAAGRAVEAYDGMEVDGAALLVLGDLGEGDAGVLREDALGESGAAGDLATEMDGEASPECARVGIPEDGGFVVVAVGVPWGAEGGVVGCVVAPAAAGTGAGAVVDGAEARRGEGGEDPGV
ncbi:hypothetical protein GCM10009802_09920 [Streptomyces synnematoformans]|uniref:Uncharacterized protein n=1 Tax=Streptomyces synnematoformans TaxID=415721 RepID=A0ABN2XJ07_9ACTN